MQAGLRRAQLSEVDAATTGVLPPITLAPGQNVKIEGPGNFTRSDTTGSDGRYSAQLLTAGDYTIEVTASGFATTIVREVRLAVGQELIQNITLQVATLGQTVEVTAETGPVRCTGTVVHPGRRVVTTEARLEDAEARLLAHATSTILVLGD